DVYKRQHLNECIPIALEGLDGLDGIIVEGNSAVEFLKPDIVVFLHSNKEIPLKQSASRLIEKADLLIHIENYDEIDNICDKKIDLTVKNIDLIDITKVISMIEDKLIEKELMNNLLQNITEDKKISCAKARQIAEALSIPYENVGKMANEMNIKIIKCELGCF
ncbi:MAG: hypothetical protein N2738_01810, partial [Thermodesulfovibrionales bacterium]|nr:hypothetical protein [Thermodesulfovibrionales bacterium]